jgi:hypothetical protein
MKRIRRLVLAALASAAWSGCYGPPPPEPIGERAQALFSNDKAAFDFFVAKGLTNFQSAGIVGNLDQESGVDPTIAQYGGGPGRGIAQWSVGGRWDTSTNDNVQWYAGQRGESATSLNLQLEFIWYELTTFGYGFSQLKASTNVTDATVAFQDYYEICGACAQSTRVAYAQAVLNAYGTAPPWAASFVSQSWPYASQPAFTVKCGESVAANIVLKNNGTSAWDANTRLGTTMPRDRASIFAGASWLGPNRAATSGSTAPGADGTFTFAFDGPTGAACKPGVYTEYFGVVQESVAWFSDNGQGGPPDNQLEALINLVPGDPAPTPDMAGNNSNADMTGNNSAYGDGGSAATDDAGNTPTNQEGSGGNPPGPTMNGSTHGGCHVAGDWNQSLGGYVLIFLCAVLLRRTRRKLTAPHPRHR